MTLDSVHLVSVNALWDTPIKRLSLLNAAIDNWDIPAEKAPIGLEYLELKGAIRVPFEQLKVQTLRVADLSKLDLPAAAVDTLDATLSSDRDGLAKHFGKVSTVLLSDALADAIRPQVTSCEIRRVMQGTTLVYPQFEALWKACE